MSSFGQLKKWITCAAQHTDTLVIYAPISGRIVDLTAVPDRIFSEKIVGDGIAIEPTGDTMVAPIDGTIGKIFETKHAFSIISDNGVEMLVHFGIDTFAVKGQGFQCIASDGQRVKKGDPIIKFDLAWLEKSVKSTLTPVIIANMDECKPLIKLSGHVTLAETPIMRVERQA